VSGCEFLLGFQELKEKKESIKKELMYFSAKGRIPFLQL
jgi:hypothetical protein